MNNWKVIFATAVIFGAGVITGGLLVNYANNSRPKAVHKPAAEARAAATNQVAHPPEPAKPRPPEILSKAFLQRLDDELRLAPDQHSAIQKIIGDGQNQMRKVIQDSRLEIREVLTPEQRKQFDELMKRPFRRPLFETNTTFQMRLEQIIERSRTNANLPALVAPRVPRYAPRSADSNMTPEQQVVAIEAERAKAINSANPPSPILPPPPPMLPPRALEATNVPAQ